jgi:threonine dehydrogenase-like Zn-dependent dehydrogenase
VRALTFQGPQTVRLEEVAKPTLRGPDEALVRVTTGAICGSDLHLYHQRIPIQPGAVLGHEFVGVVEEVGAHVTRVKPGDRVVACFFTYCGRCYYCRRGWFSQCESKTVFGYGEHFGNLGGGQAEYCVAPNADHTLEHIPAAVSDEQALFVGDILATGFFGAERAGVAPGDSVAVIGCGPVGLMAIMSARLMGAARILAVDMVDSRLEAARRLGALPLDGRSGHASKAIKAETSGHGVDRAIEAVGLAATIETAIHSVRKGGTVSVVGVPDTTAGEFPYMKVWWDDITFTGGVCNVPAYMRQLLDLIEAGRLDPAQIVSHRMKLEEGVRAYEMFDSREATKILLTP